MLLLINATIQMAKIMCKNTKLNVYIFLIRLCSFVNMGMLVGVTSLGTGVNFDFKIKRQNTVHYFLLCKVKNIFE